MEIVLDLLGEIAMFFIGLFIMAKVLVAAHVCSLLLYKPQLITGWGF